MDALKCAGRPPRHHDDDSEYIVVSSVAGGMTSLASVAWFVYKKIYRRMRREYANLSSQEVEEAQPSSNEVDGHNANARLIDI